MNKNVVKQLIVLGIALLPSVALAGNTVADDDFFKEFYDFIESMIGGGFGVGLALMSLLIGAAIAAWKSNLQPMGIGLLIAIGFSIGDGIITDLVLGSAVMPETALQIDIAPSTSDVSLPAVTFN